MQACSGEFIWEVQFLFVAHWESNSQRSSDSLRCCTERQWSEREKRCPPAFLKTAESMILISLFHQLWEVFIFFFGLNLLLITLLFVVLYDILESAFNNADNWHSSDINEPSNRRIVEENFKASKPIGNKQNVDSTVPYNMNPRLQFFLFKCFVELIFFVEPFLLVFCRMQVNPEKQLNLVMTIQWRIPFCSD